MGLAMTLSMHPQYPTTRSYVLKLHRDAMPQLGKVAGRLENLTSGHCFDFSNAEQLLACLAQDAALSGAEPHSGEA